MLANWFCKKLSGRRRVGNGESSCGRGPLLLWLCFVALVFGSSAGKASASCFFPSVLAACAEMVDSPSEWSSSNETSTVQSSDDGNSDFQGVLAETHATGSEDFPCRAYHPLTFPRDRHEPHDGALGSNEFPAKPEVTVWGGVDALGPWLRARESDILVLGNCTVHWTAQCSLLRGRPFPL